MLSVVESDNGFIARYITRAAKTAAHVKSGTREAESWLPRSVVSLSEAIRQRSKLHRWGCEAHENAAAVLNAATNDMLTLFGVAYDRIADSLYGPWAQLNTLTAIAADAVQMSAPSDEFVMEMTKHKREGFSGTNDRDYIAEEAERLLAVESTAAYLPAPEVLTGGPYEKAGLNSRGWTAHEFKIECKGWRDERLSVGVNTFPAPADGSVRLVWQSSSGSGELNTAAISSTFSDVILELPVPTEEEARAECARLDQTQPLPDRAPRKCVTKSVYPHAATPAQRDALNAHVCDECPADGFFSGLVSSKTRPCLCLPLALFSKVRAMGPTDLKLRFTDASRDSQAAVFAGAGAVQRQIDAFAEKCGESVLAEAERREKARAKARADAAAAAGAAGRAPTDTERPEEAADPLNKAAKKAEKAKKKNDNRLEAMLREKEEKEAKEKEAAILAAQAHAAKLFEDLVKARLRVKMPRKYNKANAERRLIAAEHAYKAHGVTAANDFSARATP